MPNPWDLDVDESYPSRSRALAAVAVVSSDVYCVGGFDSDYNSYDDVILRAAHEYRDRDVDRRPRLSDGRRQCVLREREHHHLLRRWGRGRRRDRPERRLLLAGLLDVVTARVVDSGGDVPSGGLRHASCVTYAGVHLLRRGFDCNGDDISNSYYGH